MTPNSVVLSIGSNCGYDNVETGLVWLSETLSDFRASSLYETPAVNGGMRRYINAVVFGSTSETLSNLNLLLKEYERSAGRDEDCRRVGEVPVDIDIVIFNGEVVREWDFRQNYFKIGYSELTGTPV